MTKVTEAELQSVDPEIRDTIKRINELPFARTVFSCAGIGVSTERGIKHGKSECSGAYLVVEYDVTCRVWRGFHNRLTDIALFIRPLSDGRCYYRIGRDSEESTTRAWHAVRQAVDCVNHMRCRKTHESADALLFSRDASGWVPVPSVWGTPTAGATPDNSQVRHATRGIRTRKWGRAM